MTPPPRHPRSSGRPTRGKALRAASCQALLSRPIGVHDIDIFSPAAVRGKDQVPPVRRPGGTLLYSAPWGERGERPGLPGFVRDGDLELRIALRNEGFCPLLVQRV